MLNYILDDIMLYMKSYDIILNVIYYLLYILYYIYYILYNVYIYYMK